MRSTLISSRRARGFTLIELLIAMAVLLIGLLSLWSLHSAAIISNANAHRLGIATTLADDMLEMLSTETYALNQTSSAIDPTGACGGTFPSADDDGLDDLPCGFDGAGVQVNGMGETTSNTGPVMFLRTYHVADVGTATAARALILVRVTYGDPNTGKRHGVTLGTVRAMDRYNPSNPVGS